MSKNIITIFLSLLLLNSYSQDKAPDIKLEITKMASLFNFVNYATREIPSNNDLVNFIHTNYGEDEKFKHLVEEYGDLTLSYTSKRPEYPQSRYSAFSSWELLWVAAAKSSTLQEFQEKIIGILPMNTYSKFISILEAMEPYHDQLIWDKVQNDNQRILEQLSPYKKDIQRAFFKAAKFYGTDWDADAPFITALIPLPFDASTINGFANGYLLVSQYATKNEKDYIGRVQVIVHEMCHVLYAQQSPEFQKQMDSWFMESHSDYAGLAYSFINEGLATAIGNGWAHKMIFGELPPLPWYNDAYISDFAFELYPMVNDYMSQNKTIDRNFVEAAIKAFELKFPDAIYDAKTLLRETQFYASVSSDDQLKEVSKILRKELPNGWFYTEMGPEFEQTLKTKKLTKVFLIDPKNADSELNKINGHIKDLNANTPEDYIDILKDNTSESIVVIIHTDIDNNFDKALTLLKGQKTLTPGKRLHVSNAK